MTEILVETSQWSSLTTNTRQNQIWIKVTYRLSQNTIFHLQAETCQQRIGCFLTIDISQNEKVTATNNVFIQYFRLVFIQCLTHFCEYQNIDVLRNRFTSSHIQFHNFETLVHKSHTGIVFYCKATIIAVTRKANLAFIVSLDEGYYRRCFHHLTNSCCDFSFTWYTHVIIEVAQISTTTVVSFQHTYKAVLLTAQVDDFLHLFRTLEEFRIEIINSHCIVANFFQRLSLKFRV